MKLKNLREFNPERVAKIETEMWQAYYRHNFLKLFILLLRLVHNQFQLGYFYTIKTAYYSAIAAIIFRKSRGKENKDLLEKKLTKFFKNVSAVAQDKFDYQKAAELELQWWMVDRYPEKYPIDRRNALGKAMASVYNIDPEKLATYSEYRAQAMELQDEAEKENKEADWGKVQSLLLASYESLYKAIN